MMAVFVLCISHNIIFIFSCKFVRCFLSVLSCVKWLIFPHDWKIQINVCVWEFRSFLSLSVYFVYTLFHRNMCSMIVFQSQLLAMFLWEPLLSYICISALLGLRVINPSIFRRRGKGPATRTTAQTIKLIYFPATLSINTKWQHEMTGL